MEEFLVALLVEGRWFTVLSAVIYALGVATVIHVLRQRKEPMAMLAWILGIILFPALGSLLYFSLGERKVLRRGRKKRRRSAPILRALSTAATGTTTPGDGEQRETGVLDDPGLVDLATVSARLTSSPLTAGNRVAAFTDAQEIYDDILGTIDSARDHINLEYYIFRPDSTGSLFRDRLAARAREGVEVRLLLDGIGCWGTGRSFLKPLVDAGAHVATFLPAVPLRRPWHINCRNHRKIVVTDGVVAHTGSQNIGDEYRGKLRRVGPWKDTHLRIEGPAARQLQETFVEDWYFVTGEDLATPRYLTRSEAVGDSLVQVVPSGPDQPDVVLTHLFFAAIANARKSVRISTPYFVPDSGLLLALQHAAHRGVRVEILIPSRTDSRLVLWAGRSFYQEMLASGIHIHEFKHGMLHSKTVVIDDRWSLVGSANMDMRSFLLNFEVTVSVFDAMIAGALSRDFDADLKRSHRVVRRAGGKEPFLPSIAAGAARLLAPLL